MYLYSTRHESILQHNLINSKRTLTLLVLFFAFIVFNRIGFSQKYQTPIGIPSPGFGIEETVESLYESNDFFTHYIDNQNLILTPDGNSVFFNSVKGGSDIYSVNINSGEKINLTNSRYWDICPRF